MTAELLGLKPIINLKIQSETEIKVKGNIKQSETELEGKFNRIQSENELEGEFNRSGSSIRFQPHLSSSAARRLASTCPSPWTLIASALS